MAEEMKQEAAAAAAEGEGKVLAAYTIYRLDNGNTRVENAEVEGATKLSTDQIFNDLLVVSRQVKEKKEADMMKAAAFQALAEYMQAAANQEKAEAVEAEVEMPEEK